jgi:uncharacterized hydrophobic protein (TIGR00341 family)
MNVFLPDRESQEAHSLIKGQSVSAFWIDRLADDQTVIRVLVPTERTESVMDALEKRFSGIEGFQIILLPVEASLPRPDVQEDKPKDNAVEHPEKVLDKTPLRISREELYLEISHTAKVSNVYVALVALSSLVAAIGLLRDNVAVLIGAMVVAPLLGPHVALSFATTLGDAKLGRFALKASLLGFFIALSISVCLGYFFDVDPETPQIMIRTRVGASDVILALAAGSAGALAFTTGLSAAVIGVMVAVALLPPLVTSGILLGAGFFSLSSGAFLLLTANVICVNLAGIVTFMIQGIRPRTWWEVEKAKKATRKAIWLWSSLLAVLALVIFLAHRH